MTMRIEPSAILTSYGVNYGDRSETLHRAIQVTRETTLGEILDRYAAYTSGGERLPDGNKEITIRPITTEGI